MIFSHLEHEEHKKTNIFKQITTLLNLIFVFYVPFCGNYYKTEG